MNVNLQPDSGATVPKFGEWDENNPQSADNFTHIFDVVRKERHTGSSNAPGAKFESPYHNARQRPDDSAKVCLLHTYILSLSFDFE